MIIQWNLTQSLSQYRKADVIILSIGKSGRTWLRVLVNKYLSLHYNIPFELSDLHKYNEIIPSIIYSHEIWLHYSEATWFQYIFGKYVIPNKILHSKKIILLCRDPRDVVVSLYHQKTRRSRKKIKTDIHSFIKHKKYGIYNIIKVLTIWHERLKNHPSLLLIRYEDIKEDALGNLLKILEFLGIKDIDMKKAVEAVSFSDFDNMKLMEASGDFRNSKLLPADPSDPNSFKVREGKVGGYVLHCSEADQRYLTDALNNLADYFGYKKDF
ncbi:MAG: sulfotransferase domain-containing protein [Nitrospirota bacterium]